MNEEKVNKFKQAIAMICVEGKSKGYFAYNFSDSFFTACGELKPDFARTDLIKVFQKVINNFREDVDKFTFDINITMMKLKLNGASLLHAI